MTDKLYLPSIILGPGIGAYLWLDKPDDKFVKPGIDPKYKGTIVLEDNDTVREQIAFIDAEARRIAPLMDKVHKRFKAFKPKKVWGSVPWDLPENDDPTDEKFKQEFLGKIRITGKTEFKPGKIDCSKPPVALADGSIRSGDYIRMKFEIEPYEGLGGGISLKLRTVQLIEKRSTAANSGPDTRGFDDGYEGGYTSNAHAEGEDF